MAILQGSTLVGCNSIPAFIAAGSRMIFEQSTAPTSWTKLDTHDNKALRVVTGSAAPGGTTAFTTVFTTRSVSGPVSGTVGDHTLNWFQMPSHSHASGTGVGNRPGISPTAGASNTVRLADGGAPPGGGAGQDQAHSHPFSGSFSSTAQDFAVAYVDVIICSKN
jgi:hypothetical protein